jgi:DNA-binding NtrC family response regulator
LGSGAPEIRRALIEAGGDRGRAADLLQINFKALEAKMRELRID